MMLWFLALIIVDADHLAREASGVLGQSSVGKEEGLPRKAKGNLLRLLTANDYPALAVLFGQEGGVKVELSIGTNGRVTDCTVLESSGSALLDKRTCEVLAERAKFAPALDSNGRATTDTYTQRVHWRLPGDQQGMGRTSWSATVDKKGKPGSCTMKVGRITRLTSCSAVFPTIAAGWAMMADGAPPIGRRVGFNEQLQPGDGEPLEPMIDKDQTVVAFDSRVHVVASDGSLKDCKFQTSQPVGAKRRCAPPPGMKDIPLVDGTPAVPALRIGRTLWTKP